MGSVITYHIAVNATRLAKALREGSLPGARSARAITGLRRSRRQAREVVQQPDLMTRFHEEILYQARREILRRGGETRIDSGRGRVERLRIADRDPLLRITLVRADGWRKYGRQGYRPASLAYLYGVDDAGPWAVRVPGTAETVAGALHWLTPAAVHAAHAAGRRVDRQGDAYAIATTRQHDGTGDLPEGHVWDPATRTLVHRPVDGRAHRPLHLPHPVRFVRQAAYAMGRSGARVDAD